MWPRLHPLGPPYGSACREWFAIPANKAPQDSYSATSLRGFSSCRCPPPNCPPFTSIHARASLSFSFTLPCTLVGGQQLLSRSHTPVLCRHHDENDYSQYVRQLAEFYKANHAQLPLFIWRDTSPQHFNITNGALVAVP